MSFFSGALRDSARRSHGGALAFQIAFFFVYSPLSTWSRYFILYLPYVTLLIPLAVGRFLSAFLRLRSHRSWVVIMLLLVAGASGWAQIIGNYHDPYVDHGPDFGKVYRYLIGRVAPRDTILVGLITNRMALSYYWPVAGQVRLRYDVDISEIKGGTGNFWTVSYKDENSPEYQNCSRRRRMDISGPRRKWSQA
jgi:hypothetical protein